METAIKLCTLGPLGATHIQGFLFQKLSWRAVGMHRQAESSEFPFYIRIHLVEIQGKADR